MVSAAPRLSAARVWWSAVRPATLAASVAAVLTGTAIAVTGGGSRWAAGLAALVVALAVQLGVNFANDYSDFVRGADRVRTGPLRAASSGVVAPAHVRWAALVAFGVAAAVGLGISLAVDPRLLLVGAACLLAGWLYTGGPRPYGYMGLGELFVFVFFGLVATVGTAYVESGRIDTLAVLMGCAMGFLATAILILNNLRDMDSDRAAGKRTLATRIGRRRTRTLLVAAVTAAFAVPLIAVGVRAAPAPALLSLAAAFLAIAPLRAALATSAAPPLVNALKKMAATQAAYALLFAAGMML